MAEDREIKIDLNRTRTEGIHDQRVTVGRLDLKTRKAYAGGIDCVAKVVWVGENFVTHAMSIGGEECEGDFYKTIERTARNVRATQKTIDTMHARVFTPEAIEQITTLAQAWYDAQDAAKAAKASAAA